MKPIIVSIIFLIIWTLIGHFYPSANLAAAFIVYPIVFFLSGYFIKSEIPDYITFPFFFAIILANDYLFRIYGGGIHDDAGRAWCEVVFNLTLGSSTIALVVLIISNRIKTEQSKPIRLILDMFFVLSLALLTLLFFRQFNAVI